jgi:DNA-binding MarR family transcriptional regulator
MSQPPPAAPELQLATLLLDLSELGYQLGAATLEENNLTAHELAVLQVLAQHSALMMIKDIHGALHGLSPSTLTRVLDSLEQKAYIVRSLNSSDRRSFQVALSVSGQEAVERYQAALVTRIAAATKQLSSGERMLLTELLTRILHTPKE